MRLIDMASFQFAIILFVFAFFAILPAIWEYWKATYPYRSYTGPGAYVATVMSVVAAAALSILGMLCMLVAVWPR